ncbi:hypothetical protein RRG08_013756 [Elysia crispata]|uniref:P-type domain-containing protein n=1 Tax=Elysia crispata TaxID=231223 RepID=A0AAE0ZPG5_9GAST|nr:hypothetical protein RRG08_013756 [Elysia crispata]
MFCMSARKLHLLLNRDLTLHLTSCSGANFSSEVCLLWNLRIIVLLLAIAAISSCAQQCKVKADALKFDCIPKGYPTRTECDARGCCWQNFEGKEDVPLCYFPTDYNSYTVDFVQAKLNGIVMKMKMRRQSPYPNNIPNLLAQFNYLSNSVLSIRIVDADRPSWEPSLLVGVQPSAQPLNKVTANNTDYVLILPSRGQPFKIKVARKTGPMVMDTTGGFIYSEQFLQLSSLLPSHLLYGLGEHRQHLMVNTSKWITLTMWNRDHPPQENTNLYGSHPMYLCKDAGGWHGIFLHNSNAMDVIVQPAPAITWRPIGGIFNFYMILGSSPADVVAQYTHLIGKSFMPPYWSLGFHLCWQHYGTAANTWDTVERTRKLGIPQDVQWNDSDYADGAKVFTTDYKHFGDQTKLAKNIHSIGLHYVIIVDCGISNSAQPGSYKPFDLGKKMGVFINGSDGKPLVGKVWPGYTVWPDFVASKQTQRYWTQIAADFHAKVPFDGMWLDMNEISNFVDGSISGCNNSRYNNPPYLPGVVGGSLYSHTICPSARHNMFLNYDLHNMYGMAETAVSYRALKDIRKRRPFIISRSTFPGQGHYGGHWSGDNSATFYDMYKSISAMLHDNMFGIPMTGSDICGFHLNTSQELCTRWHQLGAFYGFSRNHNSEDCLPQDPGQFDAESIASTRKVLLVRYSLLPFLYSLMWRSHVFGSTVARPLLFEFPDDPATENLDSQFLWGAALLISPVLTQGARSVSAYFPKDVWYDFYTGQRMNIDQGQFLELSAKLDHINLHLRGGHIIPLQEPALSTTLSRKKQFWLIVSLGTYGTAKGELYWDDGNSLDTFERGKYNLLVFKATEGGLISSLKHTGYLMEPMTLGNVTIFGLCRTPIKVTLNGKPVVFSFINTVLYISNLTVIFTEAFEIRWQVGERDFKIIYGHEIKKKISVTLFGNGNEGPQQRKESKEGFLGPHMKSRMPGSV